MQGVGRAASRRQLLGAAGAGAVLLAVSLVRRSARAAELDAATVADRIEWRYGQAKTYQARFRQIFRLPAQDITRVSRGTIAFARPTKMSFRYLEPKGDRVVSDGEVVRVYDASERRLYKTKPTSSPHAWVLSFLRGKGSLAASFSLRLLDISSRDDLAGYVLEAVPRKQSPAFAKLLFFVDAKTFAVHRLLFVDAAGNTNRFELSKEKLDAKLPKGELSLRPPRGTVTVEP